MRYVKAVMGKELAAVSRRRKTFAFRAILPAIMLIILLLSALSFLAYGRAGIQGYPDFGRNMFYSLVLVLMAAGFLLTPQFGFWQRF